MHVISRPDFMKSADFLQQDIREMLAKRILLLGADIFHPLLHTKKLKSDLVGRYSFRLRRDWRVIFEFKDSETIRLLYIEHRKDVYR